MLLNIPNNAIQNKKKLIDKTYLCSQKQFTNALKIESNALINEFNNMLIEIENYNHEWFAKSVSDSKHHIKKRSLFLPIIDGITNAVTEAMFETHDYISNKFFGKIKSKQLNNVNLLQSQTTLLDTFLVDFNNSASILNKEINNINKIVHTMKYKLHTYHKQITSLHLEVNKLSQLHKKYRYVIDTLILMFQRFYKSQKLYIKSLSITHTKKGSSPYLISPQILMKTLRIIEYKSSNQTFKFPFDVNSENLANFYQLCNMESIIINGILFIKYSLPLVNKPKYTLYKIKSFPYNLNKTNMYSYIIPQNEYIALDSYQKNFIKLSKQEFTSCKKLKLNLFMCKTLFPVFQAENTNHCEVNILRQTNNTLNCDVRVMNMSTNLWIKLEERNSYLFNLPLIQTGDMTCPDNDEIIHKIQLNHSGIIKISEGCSVDVDNVRLVGYQTIESDREPEKDKLIPPKFNYHINISMELDRMMKNKAFKIKNIHLPSIIDYDNNNNFLKDGKSLTALQELEKNILMNKTPQDIKNGLKYIKIFYIIISIVLVLCTTKVLLKIYRNC